MLERWILSGSKTYSEPLNASRLHTGSMEPISQQVKQQPPIIFIL